MPITVLYICSSLVGAFCIVRLSIRSLLGSCKMILWLCGSRALLNVIVSRSKSGERLETICLKRLISDSRQHAETVTIIVPRSGLFRNIYKEALNELPQRYLFKTT